MEVMGQQPDKIYGTIHFGNPHSESQGTRVLDNDSFAAGYHTFGCEWLPGKIIWYVDGVKFHEESNWYSTTEGQGTLSYPAPFDQPFYVILNLAIGGSWVGYPDELTTFGEQNAYEVDYVRVYQLDEYDENVTRPEQVFNPREPDAEGNYVLNGAFATDESLEDDDAWMFRTANGGDAFGVIADGKATVTTADAGSVDYSIQLMQAGLPFQKGATYEVSFDACASASRTMNVDIKAPDHGYKTYMSTLRPALTTELQTFTQVFKMTDDSDENGRLEFNLGAMGSTADVQITNVRVKKIADPNPDEKEEKVVLSNGNYIYNGSFQEGAAHLGYWAVSDQTAAGVTDLKDGRRLQATGNVVLFQDELAFTEGAAYALSFDAQAQNAGDTVKVVVGGREFVATLSTDNQTFSFKIPADTKFDNRDVSVEFNGTGTIWFDNIMLCEDSMIKNGSFSNGLTGYEVYVADDANASYVVDSLNEDNALDVTVNKTADADWKVQIKQNNVSLEKGKSYRLSFKAKSSLDRPIRVVLQGQENRGWAVYSSDNVVNLTSEYQTFTDEFTMTEENDPAAFLSICLGKVGDFESTDQHRVVLDDFQLEPVEAEVEVPKAANPLTTKTATKSVSAVKVSKQNVTATPLSVSNAQGAVSYAKKSGSDALSVNASTGTVTVKKGTKAGTYTAQIEVTAEGNDLYEAASVTVTVTVKVVKDANPMAVKAVARSTTAPAVRKKAVAVARPMTVSKAQGTVSYAKASGSAALTVNKKTGKVTVKKGTKAGTYTAKIKVTAAGNTLYASASKTVKVTVKVVKSANPMAVKAVKRTVKLSVVKSKTVTVAAPVSFTKKGQGKVTYVKVAKGSSSALTVNKSTGKVTVKKGTKKGTYTIKIKVSAAGNALYKAASKTVTCKVVVK